MSSPQKTILSVDDSLTIRKLIENALRPENYKILQAATGEEGLRITREQRPDLILLDYVLPDLRGVEFCQRLLADETTRAIPVLLISGHGSAIQELSHDCANVVDYLTKPFASNVLQAVVSNAFKKAAARPAIPPPASPAPVAVANPLQGDNKAPGTVPTPAATLQVVSRALRQRVFEKLIARLHGPLPSIPAWEAARGESEPLAYYLSRLLPLDLVEELAGELAREAAAGHAAPLPPPAECLLRGSTRFASERHVLSHLHHESATGELQLTLPEETITAWFDHGSIIGISSNHPRFYCAGSTYPFLQVPHTTVSAAMLAQRETSVPFFVTAAERGVRPESVDLKAVLRACGHRCMERIPSAGSCQFAFRALATEALPEFVRGEYRVEFFLPQLLLENHRTVSDWQHVQQVVPRLELYVGRTAFDEAYLAQLRLDPLETELLARMDFRHTVGQLQETLNQPVFEVCRAIYCLARLDLCYLSDWPMTDEVAPETAPATEESAPAKAAADPQDESAPVPELTDRAMLAPLAS